MIKTNTITSRNICDDQKSILTVISGFGKYLSAPPIASTISLQSFIGGGKGFGSRPSIKPKSTWKRRPSSCSSRLSRCLWTEKILRTRAMFICHQNQIAGMTGLICVIKSYAKLRYDQINSKKIKKKKIERI